MRDMGGLRTAYKMPKLSEGDEDFMSGFITDKMATQARMTSQIRSTLRSLEDKKSRICFSFTRK